MPARFIFSDAPLPRLGTGKIDRRALKAQYPNERALKLDRRTLLIGGGAGVGLIVAYSLWPRGGRTGVARGMPESTFGHFVKVAPRRTGHRHGAAGRNRPGRVDRAAADRRR